MKDLFIFFYFSHSDYNYPQAWPWTLCTVSPRHCDICHIHLCEACVGKHLYDESKEHYTFPFKLKRFTLKCPTHSSKSCTQLCTECSISVCSKCVSSGQHKEHERMDILKMFITKKDLMQKELQDLDTTIYAKYQEVQQTSQFRKIMYENTHRKWQQHLDKQGKALHKEIDSIIRRGNQ